MRNHANRYYKIGLLCRLWREVEGIRLVDIAHDVYTAPSNISKFEEGKNDNYNILIAYILRGFDLDEAVRMIEDETV